MSILKLINNYNYVFTLYKLLKRLWNNESDTASQAISTSEIFNESWDTEKKVGLLYFFYLFSSWSILFY